MAERVTVRSLQKFQVEATAGSRRVVLDMPVADGGDAAGMVPHEMLLSALGGCKALTMTSYAARKGFPLEGVEIALSHEKPAVGSGDAPEKIGVELKLFGPLDDAQRQRLLEISQKCPVHRTLVGEIEITSRLI
jgi:putative redox protein